MNIKQEASRLKLKIVGLGLQWTKVGFVLTDKQTNAGYEMEYFVLTRALPVECSSALVTLFGYQLRVTVTIWQLISVWGPG